MMGLKWLALLALGSLQVWADAEPAKRQQAGTTKYCPGGTPICFSEFTVATHNIIYRIAIPEVAAAPFDILLQIVAPRAVGWAAIAWGGKMSNNPLTMAWPSGNRTVVSSRFTTGHSAPTPYTGATYSVLPSSSSNATHWQLDVLCTGCSQWQGGSLNPNGTNGLAWAKAAKDVTSPASNTSAFSIHDAKAVFAHDFSQARIPKGVFDAVAYDLANPKPVTSSTPATSSSSSVVVISTGVTTLPKPSTTATTQAAPTTSSASVPKPPVTSSSSTSKSVIVVTTGVTTLPKPTTSSTLKPTTSAPKPTSSTVKPDPPKPTTIITSVTALPPKPPSTTTVLTWAPTGPPGWGWGWGKGKGHPPWRNPPVDGSAE